MLEERLDHGRIPGPHCPPIKHSSHNMYNGSKPFATIAKPLGQGSETATGTAEVAMACGVDVWEIASDYGDV